MPTEFYTLEAHEYDESVEENPKPVKRGPGRPKGAKNMVSGTYSSFTVDKKKKFINKLRKNGGNKSAAAAYVGVSQATIYAHEKKDEVFKEKVEEARNYALHEVAEEMHRRGVEGWDEPVYFQGMHVGDVRKYSDRLLEKRAEALDPETYGKKSQVEINQNVTIDHQAKNKLANLLGVEIEEGQWEVQNT